MTFLQPIYLFLLLLLLPLTGWYWLKLRHSQPSLQFPSLQHLAAAPRSYKYYLRHLPFTLHCLVFALLIISIARPQSINAIRDDDTEGIDIMLALDVSSTMETKDMRPSRLEAAKSVAAEFIGNRPNDRIALVLFAATGFLQCPLTTDHATLISLLENVQPKILPDGTAIGVGLATSVSRLRESEAVSKVVILLTDGANNAGEISPMTAAEIARSFGIRVYTVGVGEIDKGNLRSIAEQTGGLFFNAADIESLRQVYQEIDALEKSRLNSLQFDKRRDEWQVFALAALVLLLLEILLRTTVLKKIP
jgi:Ca-activated chloride channel family protein